MEIPNSPDAICVADIWKTAEDVSEEQRRDATTRACAFLLASAMYGPNEATIATRLSLPSSMCEQFAAIARESGIWTRDGLVAGAPWFEPDGRVALCLDALVLLGLVSRVNDGAEPTYSTKVLD